MQIGFVNESGYFANKGKSGISMYSSLPAVLTAHTPSKYHMWTVETCFIPIGGVFLNFTLYLQNVQF